MLCSYETMVKSLAGWTTTFRPLWTFVEHCRIKDLHFWWSGGGIFHERPLSIRFEPIANAE
jgi:hypothetical protein